MTHKGIVEQLISFSREDIGAAPAVLLDKTCTDKVLKFRLRKDFRQGCRRDKAAPSKKPQDVYISNAQQNTTSLLSRFLGNAETALAPFPAQVRFRRFPPGFFH